jgi:hypothetical protein
VVTTINRKPETLNFEPGLHPELALKYGLEKYTEFNATDKNLILVEISL